MERVGRGERGGGRCREDQFFGGGEDRLAELALRLREEERARRVEKGGQQQILEAARVQQPHRVEHGERGDEEVLAARARVALVGLAAHGDEQRVGGRPEVRDQDHRRRQIDQRQIGALREERDQQEHLDHRVREPERVRRHMVRVLFAQERGHRAVLRGREHDFRAEQHPGQQRARERDDEADADEHRAPVAHHVLEHGRHRRVLQLRELRLRHDAERQHVDQHEREQHADEADHGRAADVAALFRARREDARAFDADEHPDGDEHHVADLVHHRAERRIRAAPDVGAEHVELEREEADQDEDDERDDLRDGGDEIDERRLPDAAQHEKVHGPQQHRCARDRGGRVAFAEYGEEIAERREQQHEVADVAEPCADPVAPRGREAHVVAEARLRIGVHAAVELRLAVRERLEHEREREHADRGDRPADQDRAGFGGGRHVLRQREDAAADHRADDERGERAEPQLVRGGFRRDALFLCDFSHDVFLASGNVQKRGAHAGLAHPGPGGQAARRFAACARSCATRVV
ncbi:hypothetical protein Y033_5351 [Burkholderia pseudomallei MSHR435]|nr:hypothetical protein Y033_5351 [Burkholderia pseudomallei MSHR435]